MSVSGPSDLLLAPDVTFDVDRFDWSADGRLEVVGRWSGLRGLRFVRPVLTVAVAGRRRRLVALLEHKPWVATDGEEWIAAFPWEGDHEAVGPAQLAVGTSLVVDLPAPGPQRGPRRGEPSPAERALRRAEEAEARAARETEAAQALVRREREEHERRRAELEIEVAALREDVAAARRVADELRLELAGARARHADALAAARAETDRLREAHDRRVAQLQMAKTRVETAQAEAQTAHAEAERRASELDATAGRLGEELERAAELERRLADVKSEPEPAPPPPEVTEPRKPGTGAGDGRRTVRILDGPGRTPEVKPLLVQAAPLRRSAMEVWGRRIAAIVVLLAVLIALAIVLRGAL